MVGGFGQQVMGIIETVMMSLAITPIHDQRADSEQEMQTRKHPFEHTHFGDHTVLHEAPSTLDATRKAKQIRTSNSLL